MAQIPAQLKYTIEHEWIKIEGDQGIVGITDFAQKALGDIVFIEVPEVGSNIQKGNSFGVVESIKSVSDLFAPLSGIVTEINSDLVGSPENCNTDPYGAWMIKIRISNTSEISHLLSPEQYAEFCEKNS
jgi:glycine cleavage system H protein